MKKYIPLSLILLATALTVVLAQPQPKNEQASEKLNAMERFLGNSCFDKEVSRAIINDLQQNAVEAEAYFINLIEKGPGQEQLSEVRQDFKQIFESRSAFLAEKRSITFEKQGDEAKAFQMEMENEDAFVNRKLESLRMRLTFRCLEGLQYLNTPSAQAYLKQKSKDPNFAYGHILKDLNNQ